MNLLIGIFVGGAGRRMGGVAKGLLSSPRGGSLVEWLVEEAAVAFPGSPVVLVGKADAYTDLGLPTIDDQPPGVGPLGGLAALLEEAQARDCAHAVGLAVDMPYLRHELLAELAVHAPEAAAVAPRTDRWEPLCARWDPLRVRPLVAALLARREHSLQRVLDALGDDAQPLAVPPSLLGQLRDWDTPGDLD